MYPWKTATGTGSASAALTAPKKERKSVKKRELQSVFKLYILVSVCVAAPQTSAALLPGVSLEG